MSDPTPPPASVRLKLRPMLATENKRTWPERFQHLWALPDWYLWEEPPPWQENADRSFPLACPCTEPPITCTMRPHSFEYPGPCGTVLHWIWCGHCARCACVHWIPGLLTSRTWEMDDFRLQMKNPHQ